MQVEIDLEEQIDGKSMRDAIIEQAASKLIGQLGEEIQDNLRELIRPRLEPLIDVALKSPIQPTNRYGQPTGEALTLEELVIQTVQEMVTKKHYSGLGSRDKDQTIIEYIVDQATHYHFERELKGTIDEAKSEAIAKVREITERVIAEVLGNAIIKTT